MSPSHDHQMRINRMQEPQLCSILATHHHALDLVGSDSYMQLCTYRLARKETNRSAAHVTV
jgi:hypothetical protein